VERQAVKIPRLFQTEMSWRTPGYSSDEDAVVNREGIGL